MQNNMQVVKKKKKIELSHLRFLIFGKFFDVISLKNFTLIKNDNLNIEHNIYF